MLLHYRASTFIEQRNPHFVELAITNSMLWRHRSAPLFNSGYPKYNSKCCTRMFEVTAGHVVNSVFSVEICTSSLVVVDKRLR